MGLTLNERYLEKFLGSEDFRQLEDKAEKAHEILLSKKGVAKGNTGWLDLPENYDKNEFERIKLCAKKIRENSDIFIVIGIGGSYLGARAAIEFLISPNYNLNSKQNPKIFFVGNNISSDYINEIIEICRGKRISVNVISKSGTTTEPAIAFRIFKNFMEENYGKEESRKRIFCTTDKNKGTLLNIAKEEGYETFSIPDDIGGRFSVLSAVGLLPIAVSGSSIDEIILGAKEAMTRFKNFDLEKNECYRYACIRNILNKKGKMVELLAFYEPYFSSFSQWWKQLYAESEGKNEMGILPICAEYSTDLHSLGQFVQEGSKILFETSLILKNTKSKIFIGTEKENYDGLNFMSDKTLTQINKIAFEATSLAHYDGGIPGICIEIEDNTERSFGEMVYFFEKSCAISGLILGVNPFNQPGVEAYKKNMFALLGKPGYENLKNDIINKIKL